MAARNIVASPGESTRRVHGNRRRGRGVPGLASPADDDLGPDGRADRRGWRDGLRPERALAPSRPAATGRPLGGRGRGRLLRHAGLRPACERSGALAPRAHHGGRGEGALRGLPGRLRRCPRRPRVRARARGQRRPPPPGRPPGRGLGHRTAPDLPARRRLRRGVQLRRRRRRRRPPAPRRPERRPGPPGRLARLGLRTGTGGRRDVRRLRAGSDRAVNFITNGARLVLGALFVWASVTKIPDMAAFAESVANYRIVPPTLVPLAAVVLVGVELAAGLALVANLWTRASALVLAALLAGFTVGLTSALVRGIDLACGCFGGNAPATWWTVARDVVLLALALFVATRPPSRQARASAPAVAPTPP